ncbi:MAG: suppressor of fused domain protein [Janibacter sp.]|nr:suppressor of fused domain protein [Janibacter sp.]
MDQTDPTRDRRAEFWRGVGTVAGLHGALGDADEAALWPAGTSTYVMVTTPHSGVVATDGLSDASGPGIELYIEGRELGAGPTGEGRWLAAALEEAAGALAGAGDSLGQALTDHGVLSLELSGEHAPADWLADGCLGALVGVELPGRASEIDVDGGRVRVLTLVPLRPSELAVVRSEGTAGRRRIAEALAGQGWYSYADSTRPAVA